MQQAIKLGVNLFVGTDTLNRKFLYTRDGALPWSTWTVTGFQQDGGAIALEATRALVPRAGKVEAGNGYWILGTRPLASVDIAVDGLVSRVIGHGEPGTPPLREVPNGSAGRTLRVSFTSDFDGDLLMLADVGEVEAETWKVLAANDFGSVDQPEAFRALAKVSLGYSYQLAGQVSWNVQSARRGTVHVLVPEEPDVRIRVR